MGDRTRLTDRLTFTLFVLMHEPLSVSILSQGRAFG